MPKSHNTRIVWVEGEQADYSMTTTTARLERNAK